MEESDRQREKIENLKNLKKKNYQKIGRRRETESKFGRATTNKNGTAPEHVEPTSRGMEQQCRLVEGLQNQAKHLQGYFQEYEGMFTIVFCRC